MATKTQNFDWDEFFEQSFDDPNKEMLAAFLKTLFVDLDLYKQNPDDKIKLLLCAQAQDYVNRDKIGAFEIIWCLQMILTGEHDAALASLRLMFRKEGPPPELIPKPLWRPADVAYDLAARTHADSRHIPTGRRGRRRREHKDLLDV